MDADDFSPTGRNSSAMNSFNGSYEEDKKSLSKKTSTHRRQWEKNPCKVSTELNLDAICQSEDVLQTLETQLPTMRGTIHTSGLHIIAHKENVFTFPIYL